MVTNLEKILTIIKEHQMLLLSNFEKGIIVDLFSKKLYNLLQRSLLEGEFYDEQSESIIEEMVSILNVIEINLVQSNEKLMAEEEGGDAIKKHLEDYSNQSNTLQEFFLKKYIALISDLKENLKRILDNLEGKITKTKFFKDYEREKLFNNLLDVAFDEEEDLRSNLFKINLFLIYEDEILECSNDSIEQIQFVKDFLIDKFKKNRFNDEVLDILIEKAEFLIYKIEFRSFKNSKGSLKRPSFPIKNRFKELSEKVEYHYTNLDKKLIESDQMFLFNGDVLFEDLKMNNIHSLNRYYRKICDDDPRYRKEILNKGTKKLGELKVEKDVDKIVVKSFINILQNSIFYCELAIEKQNGYKSICEELNSFWLSDSIDFKSTFLDKQYNSIITFLEKNSYPDFYSYKIYIDFLNDFIKYIGDNPQILFNTFLSSQKGDNIDFEKFNDSIKYLVKGIKSIYKQLIERARESLRIMKTYGIKPVYLPLKDCFVPIVWKDKTDGNLFIDSSYILPNNFTNSENQMTSWDLFLESNLNLLRVSIDTHGSKVVLDQKKEDFEKTVRQNEIKTVQIVAMFVSIATFVLINVKIFDNKNSIETFGIITGLAACFVIFNLFFHFIIISQIRSEYNLGKVIKKFFTYSSIPFTLFIFSFFLLNSQKDKKTGEVEKLYEKMRADSAIFENKIREIK